MIVFDVSNVCIFLEPPAKPLQQSESHFFPPGISPEDIPVNFYEDADRQLELHNRLRLYIFQHHPAVQLIERMDNSGLAEMIAGQAHTKNLWDCCYSIFETETGSQARASLLVEYELSRSWKMDSDDRKFLLLERKKRYFEILKKYKSSQVGSSTSLDRAQAWSEACQVILEIYGIPADRMETIAREAGQEPQHETAAEAVSDPISSLHPYPHTPRYEFIVPKPKKQIYYAQVRVR